MYCGVRENNNHILDADMEVSILNFEITGICFNSNGEQHNYLVKHFFFKVKKRKKKKGIILPLHGIKDIK